MIGILKAKIEEFCKSYANEHYKKNNNFEVFDSLSPIVDTKSCFDDLRVPIDHVSRRPTDTYYLTNDTVLRTHTSAHQCKLMEKVGVGTFLCSGDVYRRDQIDASHYPVFHQMEGRIAIITFSAYFDDNKYIYTICRCSYI